MSVRRGVRILALVAGSFFAYACTCVFLYVLYAHGNVYGMPFARGSIPRYRSQTGKWPTTAAEVIRRNADDRLFLDTDMAIERKAYTSEEATYRLTWHYMLFHYELTECVKYDPHSFRGY